MGCEVTRTGRDTETEKYMTEQAISSRKIQH